MTRRRQNRMKVKSRVHRRAFDLSARIARAKRTIRTWIPYVVTALGVMVLPVIGLQGYQYFQKSDHFTVKEVVVVGNQLVSDDEVVALSGLRVGMRILDVDEDVLREKVERDSRIRWAQVEVDLPNTVSIQVKERGPAAVVVLGDLFLADERGVVFKRVDASDNVGALPFLTGIPRDALMDDEMVGEAEAIIREGIQLANAFRVHPIARARKLGELHHDSLFGWTMVLREDATEVRLGSGSVQKKLDRLLHIVKDLRARGARADTVRLDSLRDPDRVAVRMQYSGRDTGTPMAMGTPAGRNRPRNERKRPVQTGANPETGDTDKGEERPQHPGSKPNTGVWLGSQ